MEAVGVYPVVRHRPQTGMTGGTGRELGIATLVGALFSSDAFVAQFWAIVIQCEYERSAQLFGNDLPAEIAQLVRRRRELLAHLDDG